MDAPGAQGRVALDTSGMRPGGYEAVLLDGGGSEIARVSFWLRDPRAKLRLSTDRPTYKRGEPIRGELGRRARQPLGLAGVYKAGASDPHKDSYTDWAYTGLHTSGTLPPSTHGSVTLGPDTQGGPWPLPPGDTCSLPADGPVQLGRQRESYRSGRG